MALTGHRALAIAVLRQAIQDAAGIIDQAHYTSKPGKAGIQGRPRTRRSREEIMADARSWLTQPSISLTYWCDLAQIDESIVTDGVEGAIERIWQRSRAKKGSSGTQGIGTQHSTSP